MLWAGLILILVVFILVWQFAGWLLGRFGGKRNRSDNEKNARNITEAQKQ